MSPQTAIMVVYGDTDNGLRLKPRSGTSFFPSVKTDGNEGEFVCCSLPSLLRDGSVNKAPGALAKIAG